MARIFITGNRGFFGTRFESLFCHDHTILGVDRDEVDIVDAGAVEGAVASFRPDLVIHAAAITATDFSNKHPELTRSINVDGAVNVARAAEKSGAKLLFFSTEQVFNGNPEPGPYNEDHEPVPNTMYGETKLTAEGRLREIIDKLWILRFTWMCGLPERNMPVNPNVVWDAVRIAMEGRRVPVVANEYRGITWGYDMLSAVMRVPEIPYGTYHIGSHNDLGRYDLMRRILGELGVSDHRIDSLVEPDRAKYADNPRDVRLDTSRIAHHGITFEESIVAIRRGLQEFGMLGAVRG